MRYRGHEDNPQSLRLNRCLCVCLKDTPSFH